MRIRIRSKNNAASKTANFNNQTEKEKKMFEKNEVPSEANNVESVNLKKERTKMKMKLKIKTKGKTEVLKDTDGNPCGTTIFRPDGKVEIHDINKVLRGIYCPKTATLEYPAGRLCGEFDCAAFLAVIQSSALPMNKGGENGSKHH